MQTQQNGFKFFLNPKILIKGRITMTVLEVLNHAASYVHQAKDFEAYLTSGNTTNLSDQTKSDWATLLQSFNATIEKIFFKYYDAVNVETKTTSSTGEILKSSFSKIVKQILNVKVEGKNVPFEETLSTLKTPFNNTQVEVRYAFAPSTFLAADTLDVPLKASKSAIALGVASEYFLRKGVEDEALMFAELFDIAMTKVFGVCHAHVVMPAQRWPI